MRDAFERLKEELDAVEEWLGPFLAQPLSVKERELAESLMRYVAYCRRDSRKWRSESAVERVIIKINKTWLALFSRGNRRF